MQREYPDLYDTVFPALEPSKACNTSSSVNNSTNPGMNPLSRTDAESFAVKHTMAADSKDILDNSQTRISSSESHTEQKITKVSPIFNETNVKHLFECANALHMQQMTRLRSEMRDLSHRMKGILVS